MQISPSKHDQKSKSYCTKARALLIKKRILATSAFIIRDQICDNLNIRFEIVKASKELNKSFATINSRHVNWKY
jgi:hypothetical protein